MTLAEPDARAVTACAHCRKRLADEFFFTCRRCSASYCYIHMSRHPSARCERQARREKATLEVTAPPIGREGIKLSTTNPLMLVGQKSHGGSSANV